jgi:hypothetical protein
MEHRWGSRLELDAATELRTRDGRTERVTLRNVSISGALIETSSKLAPLGRVWIRATAGPGHWLEACVVRADSRGVALEWLEQELDPLSALLGGAHKAPVSATPLQAAAP